MKKLARVAFCILIFLISTIGVVPASKVHAVNMFAGKVVSWYQRITDTAIDDLVRVLADTGTEIVFRGYFKYWITPQIEFPELTEVITAVKAKLPWVQFIGGVSASAFQPGDQWPNGTYVTADQMKQMLWMPNGRYAHHIEDPQLYVLDIAKPLARQFVISYSYKMIDAGFDMLWFDEVNYIPGQPIEPYLSAWDQIASSVKDYAMSKYGRILPVSINGDALYQIGSEETKPVWPYQDFLTVSIREDTVRTGKMLDDWASYKAQVMQVYGMLPPILYFMDNDKLDVLASQSTSTQIKLLELWYDTALKEQVTPVFTLHYGDTYDAKGQGTYDTIVKLANSLSTIAAHSDWSTIKEVLWNLTAAQNAGLVSDVAKSFLANATSAYGTMAEAFMNNDTQSVTRLSATVLQLIASAYNAEKDFHIAEAALLNATNAILTAQSQNRTSGLYFAKQLLSKAYREFNAENYTGAVQLANEASRAAETATIQLPSQASSTSQATITNVPAATGIAIIISVVTICTLAGVIIRRKRSSRP